MTLVVLIKAYIETDGSSSVSSSISSSISSSVSSTSRANNKAISKTSTNFTYVDDNDDNTNIIISPTNILSLIVDNMRNTHVSLQDMIMMLDAYLTSENDKERNKATYLLADLFHYNNEDNNHNNNNNTNGDNNNDDNDIIMHDSLSSRVIHLYIIFFCNRLTDFPSIIPSIYALHGIIKYYNHIIDPKYYDAIDILRTIFKSIHFPSYAQNVRSKVLLLLHELLSHPTIISCMDMNGTEILEGIINCIEDEKDPRCLLSALKLIYKAIVCFPTSIIEMLSNTSINHKDNNIISMNNTVASIDNYYPNIIDKNDHISVSTTITLKIFDATSCYFPITFSPPPNDPFGVTPDSLVAALEDCLCAHKALLLYTIPYSIDQLHSDSSIGRTHALKLLNRIVKTEGYTHNVINHVLSTILPQNPIHNDPALQQLYDMVTDDDDDDDNYNNIATVSAADSSGLYIIDDPTTSPNQFITRNNKYLKKLSELLIEICFDEAHHDIVYNALQLIGSITWSICRDLTRNSNYSSSITVNRSSTSISSVRGMSASSSSSDSVGIAYDTALADWRCFIEPIIVKIKDEIRNNLSSMKSKAAINIAIIMCKVGNYLACGSVLRELLPILIDSCNESSRQIHDIIHRIVKDSSIGVKRLLPLHSLDSNLQSTSASVDVIVQLISCINDPGIIIINTGSVDYSQLNTMDILTPHRLILIDTLSLFIEASLDQNMLSIIKNTSTITNPFVAVKTAYNNSSLDSTTFTSSSTNVTGAVFTATSIISDVSTEHVVEGSTVAIQLPDTVTTTIAASIMAMTEVFVRIDVKECSVEESSKIHRYIHQLTQLTMLGVATLWRSNDSINVDDVNNEYYNSVIVKACDDFFMRLALIPGYKKVLQSECFDVLLRSFTDIIVAGNSHCLACKQMSLTLAHIAQVGDEMFLSALLTSLVEISILNQSISDYQAYFSTSFVLISILNEILLPEPMFVPNNKSQLSPDTPIIAHKRQNNERNALHIFNIQDIMDTKKDWDHQQKSVLFSCIYKFTQLHNDWSDSFAISSLIRNVFETIYLTVRRSFLAFNDVTQHNIAIQTYLELILSTLYNTRNENSFKIDSYNFIVGFLVNTLVYCDKKALLWKAEDESSIQMLNIMIDLALQRYTISKPSIIMITSTKSEAYHAIWKNNTDNAINLIAIIINKVQRVDIVSKFLAQILRHFYNCCFSLHQVHDNNRGRSIALVTTNGLDVTVDDVVDLFVAIIKAMMVRSEVMYVYIDGAIRSEFSDVQYNPTAMYALPRRSSDNCNDNNDSSSSSGSSDKDATTTITTSWQEYLKSFLLQLLTSSSLSSSSTSVSTKNMKSIRNLIEWSEFELVLRDKIASKLSLLSDQYPGIPSNLRSDLRINSGILWKQRTWHRLFNPLHKQVIDDIKSSSDSSSSSSGANFSIISNTVDNIINSNSYGNDITIDDNIDNDNDNRLKANSIITIRTRIVSMIAICSLITDAPLHIIQSSVDQLVYIVVYALTYVQSLQSQHSHSISIKMMTTASTMGASNHSEIMIVDDASSSVLPLSSCSPKSLSVSGKEAGKISSIYSSSSIDLLLAQSIITLEMLLKNDATVFVPYLNVIIPALVKTATEGMTAKLRATAVESLSTITDHIMYIKLHPYKKIVQKGLVKVLDDKKRAVRHLAGKVRNKWLMMT